MVHGRNFFLNSLSEDGNLALKQRQRPTIPFSWQHGQTTLLLDEGMNAEWLVAELGFAESECRYVEWRRSSFDWPREAMGALLSRALIHGEDAATEAAEQLGRWMASRPIVPTGHRTPGVRS